MWLTGEVTITAVLFDWGGTLVRDQATRGYEPLAAVADYARRHLDAATTPARLERAWTAALDGLPAARAPSIHEVLGAAFTWLGLRAGSNDIEACARRLFASATTGQDVFDDARALLASLRYRGYRTGVVTNDLFPGAFLREQANALGLSGYLDVIVTSADTGLAKPAPGAFVSALDALQTAPHDALFVGDNVEVDVRGARAAGMRAVHLVRRGLAREASGYLVVERLGALNDVLGEGTVLRR